MTHVNLKKKKKKKKKPQLSTVQNQTKQRKEKKGKKKKRKESETWELRGETKRSEIERQDRETHPETMSPPPTPTPCRHDACVSKTHLDQLILLPETHLPPSLVARDLLAAATYKYLLLSFPSKLNKYKMFVIWFENLRFTETVLVPCGLVVFHVCVFTDELNWCWWLTNCELNLCCLWCVFFFFFFGLSFWLCDSVTLCLWLSI